MKGFKDYFHHALDEAKSAFEELYDDEDVYRVLNREALVSGTAPAHDFASPEGLIRFEAQLDTLNDPESTIPDVQGDLAMAPPDVRVILERIIGASEAMGVDFLARGAKAILAVAKVHVVEDKQHIGDGTGWMISRDLLITNHHVLPNEDVAAASTGIFNNVVFGGVPQPGEKMRLRPDMFFLTNPALDYTIVKTDRARPYWFPLIPESGKLLVGERANVMHHPGGRDMQVSLRDNRLVRVGGHYRFYTSDTEPGSSGAVVCNDQWQPAALHRAGVPKADAKGNVLLTDGSKWDGTFATSGRIAWECNQGVAASSIIYDALYDHEHSVGELQRLAQAVNGPKWP